MATMNLRGLVVVLVWVLHSAIGSDGIHIIGSGYWGAQQLEFYAAPLAGVFISKEYVGLYSLASAARILCDECCWGSPCLFPNCGGAGKVIGEGILLDSELCHLGIG